MNHDRVRLVLLAVPLLAATALAGCSGDSPAAADSKQTETGTTRTLKAGLGAVSGLLVDDAFRPVPGGFLLLKPIGLTTTSNADGEFTFVDLAPGVYELRAQAEGHEAAPLSVTVRANEFAEASVTARRVFNEGGTVLTSEYSVFVDCSMEAVVVASTGNNCFFDLSGDSTRVSLDQNFSDVAPQVTVMVTEIQFNKPGDYGVVVGTVDSNNFFETYYAEVDLYGKDYVRIVNIPGAILEEAGQNVGGRNTNFTLNVTFSTAIFPYGEGHQALHDTPIPATPVTDGGGLGLFGAGADLGVKATIVQSVFLGKPEVDIASYCVLCQ